MTKEASPFYIRAVPEFEDLDNQRSGKEFGHKIRAACARHVPSAMVIDLTGAFLDYWGCSHVTDACIEVLQLKKSRDARKLSVITSYRHEAGAQYAMLFFYKSKFVSPDLRGDDYDAISAAARRVCKDNNLEFNVHVVSSDFEYPRGMNSMPDFVLSARS